MFFARTFALFFLFASVSIVSSVPTKRQDADIESVLTTLQSSTSTILPQISAIGNAGNATDDSVTPLINELTAAFNTASTSLTALQSSSRKARRQSESDVANSAAAIITNTANSLNTLHKHPGHISDLAVLLASVDVAVHEVLVGLDVLLVGVGVLISGLLVGVAGVLSGLGFTLTLGLLGLLGL